MRNLLAYPITADEVIDHVRTLRDDEREVTDAFLRIGGTRLLCLDMLAEFLDSQSVELERFLEKKQLTA